MPDALASGAATDRVCAVGPMRYTSRARMALLWGTLLLLLPLLGWWSVPATDAAVVTGGGSKRTDCVAVFDVPGANKPAPPKAPRHTDCTDGDVSCDADGTRNGRCAFDLRVCVNSSAVEGCTPGETDAVGVAHAVDDGDRRFDPDFQALQQRVDLLGLPDNDVPDDCTLDSAITVVLKGPNANGRMRRNKKRVKLEALGFATGKLAVDRDRTKFTCRPEGDGIYAPRDLYEGTFDRIGQQIFLQRCATSGCHDSEGNQGNLILLPNAAFSQIVGVVPDNAVAAADGLLRVAPGDPDQSFLYRKITDDLLSGYGSAMPASGPALSADLIELIRLWIVGDGTLGPAPQTGWVVGTDE